MNKLILCEGTTDAVLLSYYLEAVGGWKFIRKPPMGLDIKGVEENETANWYKRANDYLLICAVGGKDNFKRFYENRIKAPLLRSDAFEKIAIVIVDRDQREVENIENSIESSLSGINESFGLTENIAMLSRWRKKFLFFC